MKLLSVLSLSLVLSCTTLSAQKVYEISAFGLKANSSKNAIVGGGIYLLNNVW